MNREAYFFPPEADDLRKPLGLLEDTHRGLENTAKALGKVLHHVTEFPEVGAGKAQVIQRVKGLLQALQGEQGRLQGLSRQVEDLGEDLTRAFHDPAQTRGQPSYVYSYDRRRSEK